MNKRSIQLYFVLIVAIFNIFVFADFPRSHAKYVKAEDEKITYETSLKKLQLSVGEGGDYTTTGNVSLFEDSTRDVALFSVKFDRSNVMYTDNTDISTLSEEELASYVNKSDKVDLYTISIENNDKNSCFIKNGSVTSTTGVSRYNSSKEATVTFNNSTSDTVYFNIQCSVVDDDAIPNDYDNIYVSFKVKEKITNYKNNVEKEFTYIDFGYPEVLNEYYEIVDKWHPIDPENPEVEYLYTKAIKALKAKYPTVSDVELGEMIEYFDTKFGNSKENDEDFVSNANQLKYFTYDTTKENPFIFEDNFMGYALTWSRYNSAVNKKAYQFIFSDVDATTVQTRKTVFTDEYFDSYASDDIKTHKNEILEYINKFKDEEEADGFAKLFAGKIFGFTSSTVNNILNVRFSDSIMTIIANSKLDQEYFSSTNTVILANNSYISLGDMWSSFITQFSKLDVSLISDDIFEIVRSSYVNEDNPGIYATSITRNITPNVSTNGIVIFTDYFIVEYGSDKVLMNVYSDNTNTYVKFTKLNHNIPMLIASSVNKTEGNKTVFEIINEIDNKLGNTEDMTLTSWVNPSDTQIDTNGIVHNYYEVGSVTYDVFTKDSIEYVRYTTK